MTAEGTAPRARDGEPDPHGEARRIARAHAPDHYLSALLAPRAAQADLVAVAAFLGDVDRIVLTATEPTLAEIRLTWWATTVGDGLSDPDRRSGSPVADALIGVARRRKLPLADIERHLEMRTHDLYADPLLDEAALEAYLDGAEGAAFRLAARCLEGDPAAPLVVEAAQIYGRARLIARAAVSLARGRSPFPGAVPETAAALRAMLEHQRTRTRARLAACRPLWRQASRAERSACLPLGLAEAYLQASEQPSHDPRAMLAEPPYHARVWRLWRVAWCGGAGL